MQYSAHHDAVRARDEARPASGNAGAMFSERRSPRRTDLRGPLSMARVPGHGSAIAGERRGTSELVGAEDFPRPAGDQPREDLHADRFLDEPDRAVPDQE